MAKMKTITIAKKEYNELIKLRKLDYELLDDIAHGVKDILSNKIKEI